MIFGKFKKLSNKPLNFVISKVCRVCSIRKFLLTFSKDKRASDGTTNSCKKCTNIKQTKFERSPSAKIKKKLYREANKATAKVYQKVYRDNHKEEVKLASINYYKSNREKLIARATTWNKDNPDKVNQQSRDHYHSNLEYERARSKTYKANNKDKVNAATRRRQANKLKADPYHKSKLAPWEGKELNDLIIQEAYSLSKEQELLTGVKHNVDHIIPLKGANVCGLHIGINLQVITAIENITKGNRFSNEDLL